MDDRRHNNKRRNHDDKRNNDERRNNEDRRYNDERRNNEDRRYNDDRRNNCDRRSYEERSPRREDRNRSFDDRNRGFDDRNRGFEDRDHRRDRDNHGRGRGNGRNRGNSRRGGRGSWFGSNNESRSRFDGNRMKSEPSPEWGRAQVKSEDSGKPKEKEVPNFEPSGKLTEDANTVNGVVIKYTEPIEARKPKRQWRLYPFKGEKVLPTLYIHRQSAYLMGRDRKIADIPLDHPSCSKQHAALQFRLVNFQRENGSEGRRIRPYLIDLESANGTFVNDVKLEPRRYHELLERDVLRFGFSSREYVMLHEQSKDDTLDDDVPLKDTTQK